MYIIALKMLGSDNFTITYFLNWEMAIFFFPNCNRSFTWPNVVRLIPQYTVQVWIWLIFLVWFQSYAPSYLSLSLEHLRHLDTVFHFLVIFYLWGNSQMPVRADYWIVLGISGAFILQEGFYIVLEIFSIPVFKGKLQSVEQLL